MGLAEFIAPDSNGIADGSPCDHALLNLSRENVNAMMSGIRDTWGYFWQGGTPPSEETIGIKRRFYNNIQWERCYQQMVRWKPSWKSIKAVVQGIILEDSAENKRMDFRYVFTPIHSPGEYAGAIETIISGESTEISEEFTLSTPDYFFDAPVLGFLSIWVRLVDVPNKNEEYTYSGVDIADSNYPQAGVSRYYRSYGAESIMLDESTTASSPGSTEIRRFAAVATDDNAEYSDIVRICRSISKSTDTQIYVDAHHGELTDYSVVLYRTCGFVPLCVRFEPELHDEDSNSAPRISSTAPTKALTQALGHTLIDATDGMLLSSSPLLVGANRLTTDTFESSKQIELPIIGKRQGATRIEFIALISITGHTIKTGNVVPEYASAEFEFNVLDADGSELSSFEETEIELRTIDQDADYTSYGPDEEFILEFAAGELIRGYVDMPSDFDTAPYVVQIKINARTVGSHVGLLYLYIQEA